MTDSLKTTVCDANLELQRAGLVTLTWGNVSGIDRDRGEIVIKPSGVGYDELIPDHMVAVSLRDGHAVSGTLNPSSDTPTHLALYRAFPDIGGIVHTHSLSAVSWAQACHPIPCLGTTHADHFFGPVPVSRPLTDEEMESDYVANTGGVIVEHFRENGLYPLDIPGILVAMHGPFAWGGTPAEAVHNAVALEGIARMALETLAINPDQAPIPNALLNRHFTRKHGPDATYGQSSG